MKTLATMLTTLVLAIPAAATADALPKPIQDMECLIGMWKASGTLTMGTDKFKVDATWDCKRTSAKSTPLQHSAQFGQRTATALFFSDWVNFMPQVKDSISSTSFFSPIANADGDDRHARQSPKLPGHE